MSTVNVIDCSSEGLVLDFIDHSGGCRDVGTRSRET